MEYKKERYCILPILLLVTVQMLISCPSKLIRLRWPWICSAFLELLVISYTKRNSGLVKQLASFRRKKIHLSRVRTQKLIEVFQVFSEASDEAKFYIFRKISFRLKTSDCGKFFKSKWVLGNSVQNYKEFTCFSFSISFRCFGSAVNPVWSTCFIQW